MKSVYRWVVACMTAAVFVSQANASITRFDVIPAYAPADLTTFNSWVPLALKGLEGEPLTIGERNRLANPAAYEQVANSGFVDPREAVVSDGFNSWRGFADNTPDWDGLSGQFASQTGNRIHFGLAIETDGSSVVRLSDLSWEKNWLDGSFQTPSVVVSGETQSGTFAGSTYTNTRLGVVWGAGGPGDFSTATIAPSGTPGNIPVNAIYYVGIGDGLLAQNTGALTDQQDIDVIVDSFNDPGQPQQELRVRYTLASIGDSVDGSVVFKSPVNDLPGDYNRNGRVDAADYTVWKDNFFSTVYLDADGNGDGTVNAADYTVWKD
ncbi:MAG: hypothetical protein KDA99_30700, partial [Planctomycetales bacterium]|nr:hypothetical protein [Planctomycetales bacterium]